MPEYLSKAPQPYDAALLDKIFEQIIKRIAEMSNDINVIGSLDQRAIGGLQENKLYLHVDPNRKNVDLIFIARGRPNRIMTFSQDSSGQFTGSTYTQTYSTTSTTHANPTAANLTDNTTGTANTTLQALTDPADGPLLADDLRDDLVANLIPELRNNFADLAASNNALIADVANVKQVLNRLIDDLQLAGLVR